MGEHAVNEALRSAWEAERRDYLATEKELEAVEPRWMLVRDWIMRLSMATQSFQEDLLSSTTEFPADHALPLPIADSAWWDDARLPEVAKMLQECVHSLIFECRRRLAVAREKGFRIDAPWESKAVDLRNDGVSPLSPSLSHGRLLRWAMDDDNSLLAS